ncbi:hypothetical protein GCM10010359_01420 [Streptomyces morookaense]|nr:hypothetical protein GCM10010359_01420 [Streptomyces morookaense]
MAMTRVWSQRVKPGDVIVVEGEERGVKDVRQDWRSGTMEVVLTFKDGLPLRLGPSDSARLSDGVRAVTSE